MSNKTPSHALQLMGLGGEGGNQRARRRARWGGASCDWNLGRRAAVTKRVREEGLAGMAPHGAISFALSRLVLSPPYVPSSTSRGSNRPSCLGCPASEPAGETTVGSCSAARSGVHSGVRRGDGGEGGDSCSSGPAGQPSSPLQSREARKGACRQASAQPHLWAYLQMTCPLPVCGQSGGP